MRCAGEAERRKAGDDGCRVNGPHRIIPPGSDLSRKLMPKRLAAFPLGRPQMQKAVHMAFAPQLGSKSRDQLRALERGLVAQKYSSLRCV